MLTRIHFYLVALFIVLGGTIVLSLSFSPHASADASTLIGMVDNGDIYVKSGSTTAPWSTRLTTGENATDLQMYGDRVAFIDNSGNLWLKQGLNSPWYEEMSNVTSYALTETGLLVLQNGNEVWYKSGQSPNATWDSNLEFQGATHVYLSPSQMVIIDNSGNLLGKVLSPLDGKPAVGPNGAWTLIAQNATQAAVTDDRLVYIDGGGNVYGKVGPIWSPWYQTGIYGGEVISNEVTQVALSGTMYCYVETSAPGSGMLCKPYTFSDHPVFVWTPTVNTFALSPGEFVLEGNDGDGNTYLYGMDYSKIENASNPGPFEYYSFATKGWNIISSSTQTTEITTNQQ